MMPGPDDLWWCNEGAHTRLYEHLDFLIEQREEAESDLLQESRKHSIVKLLETAPGFGPKARGRGQTQQQQANSKPSAKGC